MFTNRTIALSRIAPTGAMKIVRDCEVAFVGKVPTHLDNRLVPCGTTRHIRECADHPGIAGIVTTADLADEVPDALGLAISDKPVPASLRVHEALLALPDFQWKDFDSEIDETAIIEPGAIIAERNVRIGAGTLVESGAIIRERTVIGNDCRIGPGVVVCCNAFEIEAGSEPLRILRQGGGVMLEDNVEVEAKSTLVRATFGGFTTIGAESKLDCQIHLAHDCLIGRRVEIAACAEISGRVTIGDGAFIGPNCSISNGLTIGSKAVVTIGSVVTRDVEDGERVTGNFAVPHRSWLRFVKSLG